MMKLKLCYTQNKIRQRSSYSLHLGLYEISHLNKTLGHILPNHVKINLTIDGI